MSDMGFTPNLIASANVNPFRFVIVSGEFTGSQATASTQIPVGVSDGSVYKFDQTQHAILGLPITLQPSNTVQVTAGAAVTAGDAVMTDSTGRAITLATAGNYSTYVALESAAAAGDVIRVFRTGTLKQA